MSSVAPSFSLLHSSRSELHPYAEGKEVRWYRPRNRTVTGHEQLVIVKNSGGDPLYSD